MGSISVSEIFEVVSTASSNSEYVFLSSRARELLKWLTLYRPDLIANLKTKLLKETFGSSEENIGSIMALSPQDTDSPTTAQ